MGKVGVNMIKIHYMKYQRICKLIVCFFQKKFNFNYTFYFCEQRNGLHCDLFATYKLPNIAPQLPFPFPLLPLLLVPFLSLTLSHLAIMMHTSQFLLFFLFPSLWIFFFLTVPFLLRVLYTYTKPRF